MQDAEFAWSWPCSWPLTNDSRANLIALCRSLSVYLSGGPGAKAGAKMEAQKTTGVSSEVPLLLVGALLTLRQVRGLAI